MNGPPSLPACGDWEGPIYGELGVLAETPDGDQVRCHACGGWYRSLATHAVRAHRLAERALARRRELLRDPSYRARVGRHVSDAKGGRVPVSCTICGAPVLITRSSLRAYQYHLCSQACIREFRRWWARELSRTRRRPRPRTIEGVCATCGATFRGRAGQRFCSRRCNKRAARNRVPGVCRICGKPFTGTTGQRFCSPAC